MYAGHERAYRGDVDACCEMRAALYFRAMKAVKNLADICREGGENLWGVASHAHKTHGRFGVCAGFGREDEVDSICLRFPS